MAGSCEHGNEQFNVVCVRVLTKRIEFLKGPTPELGFMNVI